MPSQRFMFKIYVHYSARSLYMYWPASTCNSLIRLPAGSRVVESLALGNVLVSRRYPGVSYIADMLFMLQFLCTFHPLALPMSGHMLSGNGRLVSLVFTFAHLLYSALCTNTLFSVWCAKWILEGDAITNLHYLLLSGSRVCISLSQVNSLSVVPLTCPLTKLFSLIHGTHSSLEACLSIPCVHLCACVVTR